jgi:metal-responsive CopG/Arc/MetJ family transcriptional regulator
MKTAVSIPDAVFAEAEDLARRLGRSRSQLFTDALREYVDRHRAEHITRRLNEVFEAEPELAQLDPELKELQYRSLPKEEW